MKNKKQRKGKLKLVDKFVLALTILCSLALLLSYLAPSTDPREYWVIAVLGFGYQVLVLFEIAFLLYWIVRRSPIAILPTASILLGFSVILAQYKFSPAHSVGPVKDTANIRVLQYNVHEFKGIEQYEGMPSINRVLGVINEKIPDIITLEEYHRTKEGEDSAIVNSVKRNLGISYSFIKFYNGRGRDQDSVGDAILSRYPIVNADYVLSPGDLKTQAIFVDVKKQDKIFRVYCLHLEPVRLRGRTKSKILNGNLGKGKSSAIVDKVAAAFIVRSYQVDQVKRHLEKCAYPYIITGDFNDTPNSFSVNQLSEGLNSAFDVKGSGLGVTYYSQFPKLQIDYILATPQFEILSYQAVDKKISDHLPVVSDLRLK
jgi:endonuclease/exonuclease/phosphatase family metal-dependent hydrolase